jgi:hypothetical protein
MKEAPENGKELLHSAHASGMNGIGLANVSEGMCPNYK